MFYIKITCLFFHFLKVNLKVYLHPYDMAFNLDVDSLQKFNLE